MTASAHPLSDCIEIRRQFLRSVNIEKDYQIDGQADEYIITATARHVLRRVVEGLGDGSTYRAWTLTGPYGVGKSAFAVFLTKILCRDVPGNSVAWRRLEEVDQPLAKEIIGRLNGDKGLFPLLITARRVPTALCLLEGFHTAALQIKGSLAKSITSKVESLIRDVRKADAFDSRKAVSLVKDLAHAAEASGYSGLIFMIDELGKLFEFAARVPQKGDVFVLQEIAEQASRSGNLPILFLGFLHQSFEDYGQHLDGLTRKEWGKIHGRFEDVPFRESEEQVIRLIAAAIKWTGKDHSEGLLRNIWRVARACSDNGVCPPNMRKSEFEDICHRVYPLHPVTLVALPFLFRRFAQNERSLFSFLSSLEPGGFQYFLKTHTTAHDQDNYLRLNHLFDYFTINFGGGLLRQPHARRWLEAADVLDSTESLTPVQANLVKTVGVLGALGEFSHLSAQKVTIALCLADTDKMSTELDEGITHLTDRSILTFRKYNETYRIWEGSDVDIDERIAEGERKTRGTFSLAAGIQRYLEPRPFFARRHSAETGTLRYFSVAYVDDPSQIARNLSPRAGAAGQLLVCISYSEGALQAFQDCAEDKESVRQDVVFAIPQQLGEIQSDLSELAALRWVWENTPELAGDRVARREVSLRITEAEHFLRYHLNTLLDPRKEPLGSNCRWYWGGQEHKVRSRLGVSHLLSDVCDKIYSKTPRIRNELVVRRSLSSAAAGARRTLIDRMLTNGAIPNLGIESYPPERSIYESVLKATGLHRETSHGVWGFTDPTEKSLTFAWERLWQTVFDGQGEPQSLDVVFRLLAEAPFGVMDGLHPILLCAFLQVYRNETSLYRDGTFIPEPAIADFEILMRRPELFAIAGSHVAGTRAAVVERMAKGFRAEPATVPVVRALFKMVRQLPELAWRTSRLAPRTLQVREVFEKAKAPEKFLFVDLPAALELPPLPDDGPTQQEIEEFFNTLNECLQEWSSIVGKTYIEAKNILLHACGLDASDDGWQQLREIGTRLEPREGDPQLQQFLRRVVESSCDEAGVSSVLALVSSRPPTNWMDVDVERFPNLAGAIGDLMKRARRRAGLSNEPSAVLVSLNRDQRERAKNLAHDLEKKIGISSMRTQRDVTRAALLLMAERLAEESEDSE
ncbi:hypothetical protein KJ743_03895 [Patescibacteria group bacterium]|nr:hypothetical protein [Patescibacteria group bacterium]